MVTRQKDILEDIVIKLGALKEQNEQIISENKHLREQNKELVQKHEELKVSLELSQNTFQGLEMNIKTILENVQQLQNKVVGFEAPSSSSINKGEIATKRHTLVVTPSDEEEFTSQSWSTVAKTNISKNYQTYKSTN